jgi:tetratricopeptide (TPR) repeat protein
MIRRVTLAARRVAPMVSLLALALTARAALAADDGGTRSVFDVGAGNRALALGGAFTAIADDASGSLWNPAGLAWVERGETQLAQSEFQSDFHETFAGVVLPDWRWGAVALTVRQFGASGIEQRDDRNTLISSDLPNGESEIGLAYARAIGAWGLGGALKLRRQDVAGRSGGGVGADLGVHVRPGVALGLDAPWASAARVGVALANVIEPTIRLDQESVPDPASLRMGLAVEPPLGSVGVLASLDVEKTRGVSPRLHLGLELEPHPLLALRAGLDQGALTAGTSVRFRDAELVYAFEDAAVGPTHRAGLTWRFGASTDEARAKNDHESEERFAARLAESERRRDAERLENLLAQAEAARARADLDEAAALTATARALDPNDPRGSALEARILGDKGRALEVAGDPAGAAVAYTQALALARQDTALAAARDRSRAASDAKAVRSAEVRRQFTAALDAFAADQLVTARTGFAAILAVNPADAEARTMLSRVERAISIRTQDLMRRADVLARAGLLDDAAATLGHARDLDPRAPGLASAEAELERRRAASHVPAPAPTPRPSPTPAPLTPQQERELAGLYRRGVAAFEGGRSDEALRYWELVWSIRPGYQRVDEYLEREYLTRGLDHFAAGRLEEAVAMWERALQVDPKDPRALAYLARAREQLERARAIGGGKP